MLLLSILLVPVVVGADWEWSFEHYVVRANENNILTGIEKIPGHESVTELNLSNLGLDDIDSEEIPVVRIVPELNLSNLGLEGIDPNAFSNVTDITTLNLTNNWLTTLPAYVFSKLNDLEHLSLAKNHISSLDSVFRGLRGLRSLDLSNNHLEQIGASSLFGLNEHIDIWIKGNVISNISTFLFGIPGDSPKKTIRENKTGDTMSLTNLPTSNLSENEICTKIYWSEKLDLTDEDPYGKFFLVDCTIVGINHTNLRLVIPSYLGSVGIDVILRNIPENVVSVNLTNNAIYFPEVELIDGLDHLRSLILDYCGVRWIGHNFFAEANLSVLSLSHNSLGDTGFAKTLPTSLEEIRLNNNRITVIQPGSFSGLKNLVKLDLSHNKLRNIETGTFRNLGALKELNLYGNRIHIYKGIFAGLKSIEYLNIGRNELEEMENILFAMPDTLETVILDDNKINNLKVGGLVRVPKRKLSLNGNNIRSFPKGSFDLPSLKELDLGNNQLTRLIRGSFKGLASLNKLSLAGNNITTLNEGDLNFVPELEILDLSLNPIKTLGKSSLKGMVKSERSVVFLSGVPLERIHDPLFVW